MSSSLKDTTKYTLKKHISKEMYEQAQAQGLQIYDTAGRKAVGVDSATGKVKYEYENQPSNSSVTIPGSETSGNNIGSGVGKITYDNLTGTGANTGTKQWKAPKIPSSQKITADNVGTKTSVFKPQLPQKSPEKLPGTVDTPKITKFPLKVNDGVYKPETTWRTMPKVTEREGSRIRNRVEKAITNKWNDPSNSHLFDDIDDDTIEKNIPLAKELVEKNKKTGYLGSDPDKTYPYMLDGMTMYLASGDKNKPKAARKARDVAYTQYFDSLQQKTDNGFVLNQKQHNNTLQKPTIAFQRDDIFDFNDIIRNTTNTTSNTTSSKKDGLIQNDNVRFVGENQVRFREKPGMDSSVLGLMDKGTEVEYTGYKTKMIDGHMWAEVIYNGEIGWVAADYLKISNPAETYIANSTETKTKQESTSPDNTDTFSNENQETTDNINSAEQQKLTQKAEPVSRYVGEENVRFRSAPGLNSSIIKEFKKGTELKYTGNKTAEIDGHMWAEVVYDGKTGWIAADYLKISKQAVSNSVNPKSHYETIKSSTSTIENNHSEKLDLSDFSKIQTAFQNYKIADTAVSGDFDGWYGLQCVDLTNWFINEYTSLGKTSGNGCDKVEKIANLKDDLEISIIPSAPAVFSISPGKPGPGVANTSDPKYGHTGIVLDVKIVNIPPGSTDPSEYTYAVTYLHTYSNLSKTEQNSSIVTKNFIPNEGVTYVNIGNYLK